MRKPNFYSVVFYFVQNEDVQVCDNNGAGNQNRKPLSSTPGNVKKVKRARTINPNDVAEYKARKIDREATESIKAAADKIMEAAMLFINCMNELRPELKALSNRNYREIQISTNAVKQLVSNIVHPKGVFYLHEFF